MTMASIVWYPSLLVIVSPDLSGLTMTVTLLALVRAQARNFTDNVMATCQLGEIHTVVLTTIDYRDGCAISTVSIASV